MYVLTVIPGKLRMIPMLVLVISVAVAMVFVILPKAYASEKMASMLAWD
jgi:hypothetical protein